jgi:organic hydroperoxide reductase OsmC/OhrA
VASVTADASPLVRAEGLPDLHSASPREFDGPGDQWSPESLLVGAAASCFLLTFKVVARIARLEWQRLDCSADGTLDRVDGVTQFTHMRLHAKLTVADLGRREAYQQALEKAERNCLVSNSLRCTRELTVDIVAA